MPQPSKQPQNGQTLVSVIVPVGPGDTNKPLFCSDLFELLPGESTQVIIAGPQAPRIMPQRPELPIAFERTQNGRTQAMNAGAAKATGNWLWFIHADTLLRADDVAKVMDICKNEPADCRKLYYFDLYFTDAKSKLMRINEWGVWLRSRLLKAPFGDQALLVPAHLFNQHGGYDTLVKKGEDHLFVKKLSRAGVAICPIGAKAGTSARKYNKKGWLKTTAEHLVLTLKQHFAK